MHNTTKIQRLCAIAFLSAAVFLAPLNIARADDEHEHEHEGKCHDCGVVTAVQTKDQSTSGLTGAAAGAATGGVVGHQAGQTTAASSTIGSIATTVIGAVGGAVGGYYAEKAVTASKSWNVTVKMNGGDSRTINMPTEPKLKVGDHVLVKGDSVTLHHGDDD